ncbi:transient receptor potential cation channel subfamily M member 2 [Bufo bufo]|uniref:transient receptor potential cation channel subfamily M member 2 n=1 Tax=Bufo bufo TaxID=8384 RepID=UPI001ABE9545|nr:transient receptor potential cation channel subfamily M member 2 [Bufo bufo]
MSSAESSISQDEDRFKEQPNRISNLISNLRQTNKIKRKKRTNYSHSGNEKENICSWIAENIKKKECMFYVESPKVTDTRQGICMCGYSKEQHIDSAVRPQIFQRKRTWDVNEHIKEMPTDAFGDINFIGMGSKTEKQFVRVSSDTPSNVLYQLMTEQWGLEVPNLLISVTGGAKNFRMKMRLRNIFRRGLVKAAETTGAWIITGGSHAGVMKQVGEAVRDFSMGCINKNRKMITIGIATWGVVHNRNSLISTTGSFPAQYQIDEESQGSLSCLDNNHSHFILVDDGTNGRYGAEILLRAKLEKFISEQTKEKGGVFTESYRKDEERALKLLIRVSESWGQTTCLKLALEAKDMKFVSQGGVQAFLTRVWFGELSVDNSLWRVIACMIFFPLLYTRLLTFRSQTNNFKKTNGMTPTERFQGFFMAPVVIFHLNILAYFGFLLLFAYVLMIDFQPTPSWREQVIYFWLFSLVCEETRQVLYDPDGFGLLKQTFLYISDFWNKLDVCAILIFISGLICRLIPATFYPGRIILSLDFVIFCLRLMHIFTISKTLGPKIIIVKRMMKDVFFFLFLLAVWVVSFGVAKQAILIHNEIRVDWIFRGVVYHSYMTLFGQIPSYIDGVNFNIDQCTVNGTDPNKQKCPESNKENHQPVFPQWLTVLLLCLYLLFTNILLLNLLIAMFNYTFQQVQEHTDQIWKFQRHDLIEEYHSRPPAPPPFILFNHLHLFIKHAILHKPSGRQKQLKEKLEKNEESTLLSWETFLKENYIHHLQKQMKQSTEQKIRDTSEKVNTVLDMLELDQVKRTGSMENRLIFLEEQTLRSAKALNWIVNTLLDNGFGSKESAPVTESSKLLGEIDLKDKEETVISSCHVNARDIHYPDSNVVRFPVPDEKIPWEVEFSIYNPTFYTAIRKDKQFHDPYTDSLETLQKIHFNTFDGTINRQSYCATYLVQDGLPLNPVGRTGLRGRGSLCWFGPNHAIHSIITRWKRNKDGSISRKKSKKMLEILAMKHISSEHWALPGGSLEPGETFPLKLKRIINFEFLEKFQQLLNESIEVYKGYVDDPRNTDNAWIETTALSLHFETEDDPLLLELNKNIQTHIQEIAIRWQVVDQKIPLYANHKDILQKAVDCYNAYY